MRITLLILLMTAGLMSGCTVAGREPLLVHQEADPLFKGVERHVVHDEVSTGSSAYYYFTEQSEEDLIKLISTTSFFQAEGWIPFKKIPDGDFVSRPKERINTFGTKKHRAIAIIVTSGRIHAKSSALLDPRGCTVIIVALRNK